jgi:hypothetical protein
MGGFIFEDEKADGLVIMNDGYTRITLTPVGFRNFAKDDSLLLLDVSEVATRDKSKAERFVNFSCLQRQPGSLYGPLGG